MTGRRAVVRLVAAVCVAAALALVAGCSTSGVGQAERQEGTSMFDMSSPAFETGGLIPAEHATTNVPGGQNFSIPYEWRNPPSGTKSFALALIDRAPVARDWVHWVVYDIPASTTTLARGASGEGLPAGARELKNGFGSVGYGGPQPPSGTGKHPYEATLYALDVEHLDLSEGAGLTEFERAIQGHVLDTASVTGLFGR